MNSRRVMIVTLLIVFTALTIFGQTSTGEVNGTVADPSGAAVPGGVIKLINQATKIETQVTANEDGYFTFVNVKPGNYVLGVEKQGFKRIMTAQFTLGVSETVSQCVSRSSRSHTGRVFV